MPVHSEAFILSIEFSSLLHSAFIKLIDHDKIILKYVNPEIDIAENAVEMHKYLREQHIIH